MPAKTERDEQKWEKAKAVAKEQGKADNFAYIMGIYKKMKPDYFEDKKAAMRNPTVEEVRGAWKTLLQDVKSVDDYLYQGMTAQGQVKAMSKVRLAERSLKELQEILGKFKPHLVTYTRQAGLSAQGLPLSQVKALLRRYSIPGELSGQGKQWELEVPDEDAKEQVEKVLKGLGGYKTGYGSWVLSPTYQDSGDWNDPSSRWHYASADRKKKANQIGQIIADQMGGVGRIKRFLGARVVKAIPNGLAFDWRSRQRSKGNYVEITLQPSDTYKMEFFNVSTAGKKLVKTYHDIYNDQLVDIFENQTGWYLRMASSPKIKAALHKVLKAHPEFRRELAASLKATVS